MTAHRASLSRLPIYARWPWFSPDGKQLAMGILRPDSTMTDLWLYDMSRKTLSRMTFADADDEKPVWFPDGERIVFFSLRGNRTRPNMYSRRVDGSGEVERLQLSDQSQIPQALTPDGQTIIYVEFHAKTKADLWSLAMEEGAKPEPFLVTRFNESQASLSPNGKWLAYTSNESGRSEIYLRPFPKATGKWQISTNGGEYSMWSPDGKELFYRKSDTMMVVAIDSEVGMPVAGQPKTLFDLQGISYVPHRSYDISPDGQRFVMIKDELAGELGNQSHLRFVFNWFNELDAKVPRGKQ